MNWLLSGDARVVVIPLQNCLPKVRTDPRLSVALPVIGSPIHWNLLVSSRDSKEPLPINWIENIWSDPLLGKLLADGWIPPLRRKKLRENISLVPAKYRSVVIPPDQTWSRFWSLNPLNNLEKQSFVEQWQSSSP